MASFVSARIQMVGYHKYVQPNGNSAALSFYFSAVYLGYPNQYYRFASGLRNDYLRYPASSSVTDLVDETAVYGAGQLLDLFGTDDGDMILYNVGLMSGGAVGGGNQKLELAKTTMGNPDCKIQFFSVTGMPTDMPVINLPGVWQRLFPPPGFNPITGRPFGY